MLVVGTFFLPRLLGLRKLLFVVSESALNGPSA